MRLPLLFVTLCACSSLLRAANPTHWVATWADAAAPQWPDEAHRAKAHLEFENQTIREIVHTSVAGNSIRIRLSNQFGQKSVQIGAVHVATCGDEGKIMPGSDHTVTFSGRTTFNIPPNSPFLSDPVDFTVPAATNLCISLFLPTKTTAAGIHYSAQQNNYIAAGDATALAIIRALSNRNPRRMCWVSAFAWWARARTGQRPGTSRLPARRRAHRERRANPGAGARARR